jgi:hypothetical protein
MGKNIEELVKEKHYLGIYGVKALKECPLLSDEKFKNQYPGIVLVAAFICATREICRRNGFGEAIPLFEERGIKDLNEYLELIPCVINKGTKAHYLAIKERIERFYS